MTNFIVYRDGDKYVMDTGKAPRQFQGVLSIVYVWTSTEDLEEAVYPSDQLSVLPKVKPSSLSSEVRHALERLGMPVAASNTATRDIRAPVSTCHVGGSRGRARRPARRPAPSPMGWRDEYKAALVQIWDGWAFCFTPIVLVWLPFALMQTALWSVVALGAYIHRRLALGAWRLGDQTPCQT